jgi:hypothetical protein
MGTAEHLRQVAEHWRRLAALVADERTQREIEKLAEELEARAQALEDETGRSNAGK